MKSKAYFKIYDELVRPLNRRWIPYTDNNWNLAIEKVGGAIKCLPNGSPMNTKWVHGTVGKGSWDYVGPNGRTICLVFVGVLD